MNDRHINHGESSNFPEEAFDMIFNIDGPVEFHNSWLSSASEDEQLTAMRDWFTDRYCDPANETPYNGREGGYLYMYGGPYNPTEELNERFSQCIPQHLIDDIATELESEGGDEWAPIIHEMDYDDYFAIEIDDRFLPKTKLENTIKELEENLKEEGPQSNLLILHMSYGMLISCLEAYLSETVIYWAKKDDDVLFRIAIKEFDTKKYSLSEIFNDIDVFKEMIHNHLASNVVWHRLDKLKPTIEYGLKINLPKIGNIMSALKNRHDIAHRGGFNKDGTRLELNIKDFNSLKLNIVSFITELEEELEKKHPLTKNEDDDIPY